MHCNSTITLDQLVHLQQFGEVRVADHRVEKRHETVYQDASLMYEVFAYYLSIVFVTALLKQGYKLFRVT